MNKAIIIKSEWSNKKRITKDDFENLLKEEEKWNLIILLQKKKRKNCSANNGNRDSLLFIQNDKKDNNF